MSHIRAEVRLRPVRFGFLIEPNDNVGLREAFQINTCLWGGKFNPIIPYFKRIPKWWDRNGHRFETASQVVNGYLDFFEPDFLVEAKPGLSHGLGFEKERVLQPSDILRKTEDQYRGGHGLDVLDLYNDLYQTAYQFERRHAHNIVDVHSNDRSSGLFQACVFGEFPSENIYGRSRKAYIDVFSPRSVNLDARRLSELYETRSTSALLLGQTGIKISYYDCSDPALFVLDMSSPADLIDYWNLRTIRPNVLPIPLQWADDLSAFSKKFIVANHRPLPGNHNGVMICATVMFSRSIPTSQLDGLYEKHFQVEQHGANVRCDWYPSIWRATPDIIVRTTRPILSANLKTFDLQADELNSDVRFDSLRPNFANQYVGKDRWVNVVNFSDWSDQNEIAIVFPCEYKGSKYSVARSGLRPVISTTEGFVVFVQFNDLPHFWKLPNGSAAIEKWLSANGITSKQSDAGQSTRQIIQSLRGPRGLRSIAHPEIVKLLNEIARRPIEPRRVCRRLQLLRRWSHYEQDNEEILFRGSRPRGAAGPGSRRRALFAVGGGDVDRSQDRLHGADAE